MRHILLEIWFWSAVGAAISCCTVIDLRKQPESRWAVYLVVLIPFVNTIATFFGIVIALCVGLQILLNQISD